MAVSVVLNVFKINNNKMFKNPFRFSLTFVYTKQKLNVSLTFVHKKQICCCFKRA